MKQRIVFIITVLFVFCLGCATAKQRTAQLVVASDKVADEVAEQWSGYVDAQIAHCREMVMTDTSEARAECMGIAAKGEVLEGIVEALVAAQLAAKIAVDCESNPLKVPVEFHQECVADAKADWAALGEAIWRAWNDLRPYFEAIKGAKKQ